MRGTTGELADLPAGLADVCYARTAPIITGDLAVLDMTPPREESGT